MIFVGDYEDLTARGARIVHNSYINSCSPIATHQNVINFAAEQGVIVVGSAGNGEGAGCGGTNFNNPVYPSAYDNVISVSSVSAGLCCETTYNFWEPNTPFDPPLHHTHNETVDVLAQGYALVTGNCNGVGGQSMSYGTSIAGPHVAGIIGLILSVNPCLNHDDVLYILQSTGQDVTGVCNNSSYYPNGAPPVPCAEDAVLMALNYQGNDLVIAQDTDWDQKFISGDVIINSGVTLTIFGTAYFAKNSRILVEDGAKLIVDGGTLTSCADTWKGVRVDGGNSDFDVKFTNNAIIENTSSAAVSMFAPLPWPQIQQFGNGILQADNTTFNNTKRIVEFMSWSPLPNPSYIENCVQNGGKWCITNWNCQGIQIVDNTFNNITHDCVVTETGSFNIVGNEFNSGQNDILFNNISAGISTIVDSNTFNGSNVGYNARGTTLAQNEIYNNNFQAGLADVINDGHNQYNLYGNDITATFGSVNFDNGGGIGDVHNNDFSGNFAGTLTSGNNTDYNFYENCFNTTFIDAFIIGQISPIIHSNFCIDDFQLRAANNCFTHQGAASNIQDIGGNPDPFTYLEPNDDPLVDCRDAILADPDINRFNTCYEEKEDCGSNLTGGGEVELNYCFPKKVYKEVSKSYNWILSKLNEIENDRNLTEQEKEWFTEIYATCFWRVRGYLFELYIKQGKYEDARALYAKETHDDAKVYIYSAYILENNLSGAENYLKSIKPRSEQMHDFIEIQHINLKRLPYGPLYKATVYELDAVNTIAHKLHPYAAYGKALYYALTGEVISSKLPDIGKKKLQTSRNANLSKVKVYPNPFGNFLNLDLKGYEKIQIEITDFFGRIVYDSQSNQTNYHINTENWDQGMYFIKIKSNNKLVYYDKLVLIQ